MAPHLYVPMEKRMNTCVACISVWACWVRPVCLCGNYCDLNAGRAGESGCLLINEGSRWPCGGRELQRHSECGQVVNTRRTHKNTWAVIAGGQRAVCILLYLCCTGLLCSCEGASVIACCQCVLCASWRIFKNEKKNVKKSLKFSVGFIVISTKCGDNWN